MTNYSSYEFAKKLNITIGAIRYYIIKKIIIPIKNKNNRYEFTIDDEEKIKNWLERKKTKYDFTLLGTTTDENLAKIWGISRERVRQFRKKRNVQKYKKPLLIKIKKEKIYAYEHCIRTYKNGCSCNICKLSNKICTFCCKQYGKSCKNFYDIMANKHLILYLNDKSRYKRNFYNFIRSEYENWNKQIENAVKF